MSSLHYIHCIQLLHAIIVPSCWPLIVSVTVQGFCCPLQQRPTTGRIIHGVTPLSREGGDGSLTLLSSLKERLESRVKPASRSRNGNRPEKTLEDGAPTVSHHRDPVRETAGEQITLVHVFISMHPVLADE